MCMYLDYNLLDNRINNLKLIFQTYDTKLHILKYQSVHIYCTSRLSFIFTVSKNTYRGLEMALVVHFYSLLYPTILSKYLNSFVCNFEIAFIILILSLFFILIIRNPYYILLCTLQNFYQEWISNFIFII